MKNEPGPSYYKKMLKRRKGGVKRAVVLLSGGLDSATTLFWAKNKGYKCFALSFDYGQRHKREIRYGQLLAKRANISWRLVKFKLPWAGSALLDKKIAVPKHRAVKEIPKTIPSTYVPARNTIFLALSLSYAETIGAGTIFIGANAVDFSGYPDCRPKYYQQFNRLIQLATKAGVEGKKIKIFTPLIKKTKAGIIKTGSRLKVPYELTWSCYEGKSQPCGYCDSCLLRAKGFKEAGLTDPLLS